VTRKDELRALIVFGVIFGLAIAAMWHGITVAEDRIEYQRAANAIAEE
jgi:hypothetical protein